MSKNIDPKTILRFHYDELKKLKDDYDPHAIFAKSAELRDYCLKLNFPRSKGGILLSDIQFLVERSQEADVKEALYQDNPQIIQNNKNNLIEIIDKVLYQLDSAIRHPEEITLKPARKNKKGFFSFFKKNTIPKTDVKPVSIDVMIDNPNFKGDMLVFISHKISDEDVRLAKILRQLLVSKNLGGYIAESKPEYDFLVETKIREKIKESGFLVGILTRESIKSASVNQEIGYALGCKKPVALLVEEGLITEGVLTHGRDVELFNQNNFNIKCERIINYILEKRNITKISDDDKKVLIENVYRQCYDQMTNVYKNRNFIMHIPENPWDKISPSWRLKTEPEIKNLFEQYSQELEKWRKMWIVDFGNKFQSKNESLAEILRPAFNKTGLIDDNGYVHFGERNHTPKDWLFNFRDVIFNENIVDSNELYDNLKKYALKRWGEEYSLNLDKWKKEKPAIFDEILKMIPALVKGLDAKYSYIELEKQRSILKELIEKLTLALEEKLR